MCSAISEVWHHDPIREIVQNDQEKSEHRCEHFWKCPECRKLWDYFSSQRHVRPQERGNWKETIIIVLAALVVVLIIIIFVTLRIVYLLHK
jgi:uncharacterized membrane protein YvbJ